MYQIIPRIFPYIHISIVQFSHLAQAELSKREWEGGDSPLIAVYCQDFDLGVGQLPPSNVPPT